MEYFARAVEIVLKDCTVADHPGFVVPAAKWTQTVHDNAYVQAQQAASRVFTLA